MIPESLLLELIEKSRQDQIERGIRMNPDAAIQQRIEADGYRQVQRELYHDDTYHIAYQGAEHPRLGYRRVYYWTPETGVFWRWDPHVPHTDDSPPPTTEPPKESLKALVGLHASADGGDISDAELAEFRALRPGVVKVLSSTAPPSVERLAAEIQPSRAIVRAFLSFGGRRISPEQFVDDTRVGVVACVNALRKHGLTDEDIVLELGNEPNLLDEGLGTSWSDGAEFGAWFLRVVELYDGILPNVQKAYPGLSPGEEIWARGERIRAESQKFLKDSIMAAKSADAVCFHVYWSNLYPMNKAVGWCSFYQRMLPSKRLWISEASNNEQDAPPSNEERAEQYARFAQLIGSYAAVEGVTYFVASSQHAFRTETWVGKDLGRMTRAAL